MNDKLNIFCTALRDYEGKPGDLNYTNNNPGNCRCSPVGYLPKYGEVRCVNDFAVFATYDDGWEYLKSLVFHRVGTNPEWTFIDFFNNYAPTGDNNNPHLYAKNVAAKCGVLATTTVSAYLSAAMQT